MTLASAHIDQVNIVEGNRAGIAECRSIVFRHRTGVVGRGLVMVGWSFVPVIVIVTTWSNIPPWPSSIVTVKLSVTVSPAAKY
ncbi:MAG: hypothetical protein R3D29_12205 [Nitratireductor sp.]